MSSRMLACLSGWTVVFLLAGCGRHGDSKTAKPPVVRVVPVIAKKINAYEHFTGRTEAVDTVEVRARVTGYLTRILFTPGTTVKKDQVLFVIDPRPYQAQFDQADSQVDLEKARLELAKADLERAKEIARTPGAISQQDLDKYAATLKTGLASLEAAKASRETADLNLKWTEVRSPITGLVSRNLLTIGNLVTQDQTLLTTVVSEGSMYGYFDVDENTVLRIRQLIREGKIRSARDNRLPVQLGLANEGGEYPHKGELDFINNQFDSTTGTVQVRGEFPNPMTANGGPAYLAPGMFVRIRFPVGDKTDKLLVPQIAIGTDQGKKFLLVVNDKNVVEYRPVKLGPQERELQVVEPERIVRTDKGVRLARPGETGEDSLKAGERVIVGGLQRVRPGSTVDPKDAALEFH